MERVLYNTILGAKPLQVDGRAFYYSDYHSPAAKSWFPDAWPCCSGTFTQVAADYRLLIYFHDSNSLWINLYLPSTLHWVTQDGAQITVTQSGNYPQEGLIDLQMRMSRPSTFTLLLRLPAWATPWKPVIRVNGEATNAPVTNGFAAVERTWKNADRVELEIP